MPKAILRAKEAGWSMEDPTPRAWSGRRKIVAYALGIVAGWGLVIAGAWLIFF